MMALVAMALATQRYHRLRLCRHVVINHLSV